MNLSSGFCYFKYVGTLITPQTHAVKGNKLKKKKPRERLICFVGLFLQHVQCLHSFDYLRQCNLTFFCFRNWEFLNCLLWISLKMYLYWVQQQQQDVLFWSAIQLLSEYQQSSATEFTCKYYTRTINVFFQCIQMLPSVNIPVWTAVCATCSAAWNYVLKKGCCRYRWILAKEVTGLIKNLSLSCEESPQSHPLMKMKVCLRM